MKASVEVINPYHKKKLTQLFTMKFTKMKLMGADLGIGQNVGLGFYKVVTFFFTKYRNQHQFVILEGVDTEGISVYLLTELCSTNSGSGSSNGRSGYFLYYSREVEQLLLATNQKNPVCNYTFSIFITGEDVFEGVTREKEKYKIIGNNCQDYAERFIRYILEKSQDNMKNDSVDELHLSQILSFKKKKKKGKKYIKTFNIDDSSLSNCSNQDNEDDDSKGSDNSRSISISASNELKKKSEKNKNKTKPKDKKININQKKNSGKNKLIMMNTADQFNKKNHLSEKLLFKLNENNSKTEEKINVQPRLFNLRLKNDIVKEPSEKAPSVQNKKLSKLNNTSENFMTSKNNKQRVHTADTNNQLRNEVIENKLKENGLLRSKLDNNTQPNREIIEKNKSNFPTQESLIKEITSNNVNSVNTPNSLRENEIKRKSIILKVPDPTITDKNIDYITKKTRVIILNEDSKDIKESNELPIIKEKLDNEEKSISNNLNKKEELILSSFNRKNESCDGNTLNKIKFSIRDKKLFNIKTDNPIAIYNKEPNNNSHEIVQLADSCELSNNNKIEGNSLKIKKIRSDVVPVKMFYNTSNNFTQHVQRVLLQGKENRIKHPESVSTQSPKVGLYKQGVIMEDANISFNGVNKKSINENKINNKDKKVSSITPRDLQSPKKLI